VIRGMPWEAWGVVTRRRVRQLLVDGWTAGDAADVCGLDEVDVWAFGTQHCNLDVNDGKDAPVTGEPTRYPPGSIEKRIVMAVRAERGEPLFHREDATLDGQVGLPADLGFHTVRKANGTGRKFVRRTCGESRQFSRRGRAGNV